MSSIHASIFEHGVDVTMTRYCEKLTKQVPEMMHDGRHSFGKLLTVKNIIYVWYKNCIFIKVENKNRQLNVSLLIYNYDNRNYTSFDHVIQIGK